MWEGTTYRAAALTSHNRMTNYLQIIMEGVVDVLQSVTSNVAAL